MAISIEKILNITPTEWSKMTGADLSKYNPVGVFAYCTLLLEDVGLAPEIHLAEKAPRGTEVILNYHGITFVSGKDSVTHHLYGTALVSR